MFRGYAQSVTPTTWTPTDSNVWVSHYNCSRLLFSYTTLFFSCCCFHFICCCAPARCELLTVQISQPVKLVSLLSVISNQGLVPRITPTYYNLGLIFIALAIIFIGYGNTGNKVETFKKLFSKLWCLQPTVCNCPPMFHRMPCFQLSALHLENMILSQTNENYNGPKWHFS